jgi:hypothetical protein
MNLCQFACAHILNLALQINEAAKASARIAALCRSRRSKELHPITEKIPP